MDAIGTGIGTYQGTTREWLYWYDEEGSRYAAQEEVIAGERAMKLSAQKAQLSAEQTAAQERAMRLAAQQRSEQLATQAEQLATQAEQWKAKLIELGIDPEDLD